MPRSARARHRRNPPAKEWRIERLSTIPSAHSPKPMGRWSPFMDPLASIASDACGLGHAAVRGLRLIIRYLQSGCMFRARWRPDWTQATTYECTSRPNTPTWRGGKSTSSLRPPCLRPRVAHRLPPLAPHLGGQGSLSQFRSPNENLNKTLDRPSKADYRAPIRSHAPGAMVSRGLFQEPR
jgi:hypothetical protein